MKKSNTLLITGSLIVNLFLFMPGQADDHMTAVENAVNAENRSAKNKARDVYRHPAQTLSFFGVKEDMRILEILPGRGWYTQILAPLLREKGQLSVASFGANHPSDYLRGIHNDYITYLNSNPAVYDKIDQHVFLDRGYLNSIASESQDMVLTFRNSHNWVRYGGIEDVYQAFHRVLKKGGVLGVVQHRADKNSDPMVTADQGYLPEPYLIKLIESMGFKLVEKSEINANPKDTKNYSKGVWTLPPSYRLGDEDKAKYSAIGESDRMTLRFVKL